MPPTSSVAHDFDSVLADARQFLLSIANAELPVALHAKGGASDLVQNAMLTAHKARRQFEGRTVGELRAWLRAILKNEMAMFRRKYVATASRDVGNETAVVSADFAGPSSSPISELIRREQDERLVAAISLLPHDCRKVLALRTEQGLSFAAIGEQMASSEDAVRRLFARAIELLRSTVQGTSDKRTV